MHYSKLDQLLIEVQNTLLNPRAAQRPSPAETVAETPLSLEEKKHSAGLMRVNHTGEICAQALYLGQALVARDPQTEQHLLEAAQEEADHLHWCAQRVQELGSQTSVFNWAFFSLSVLTGMLAGLASDKISLGFIAETEHQVAAHLSQHLTRLSPLDEKSAVIIEQMKIDEIKHQQDALNAGAAELPLAIQTLMRLSAKMMTSTTYYF